MQLGGIRALEDYQTTRAQTRRTGRGLARMIGCLWRKSQRSWSSSLVRVMVGYFIFVKYFKANVAFGFKFGVGVGTVQETSTGRMSSPFGSPCRIRHDPLTLCAYGMTAVSRNISQFGDGCSCHRLLMLWAAT